MPKKTSKEAHHDSPGRNSEGQSPGGDSDITSWQLGRMQACKNEGMWCYLSLSFLPTSSLEHSSCPRRARGTSGGRLP